jgi:HlyD family type I secretion membrane fusion protein
VPAQRKVYEKFQRDLVVWLQENPLVAEVPIAARIRLRQMTLAVPSIGANDEVYFADDAVSTKYQALLEIVPVDDKLLIEARVRPADIAFLRPGLNAVVKLTAYDATQYGWLTGSVVQISPDTLQDEVRRDETYYRVVVKTDHAALSSPAGQRLPIIPGMVAQVDIKTGQKSVLSYLFKPVLKAREALRER